METKPIKKRNKTRISLPNGASCTEPHVNPDNWHTARASLKKDWYVTLNYYSSSGERKIVTRKNMNSYSTLVDRQIATRSVIEILKADLENGWDPINDKYPEFIPEKITVEEVVPEMSLSRALAFAIIKRYKYRPRIKAENGSTFDKVLIDVRGYVRRFLEVAKQLGKHRKPITTVRRRDVLEIMDELARQKQWGYASWNNCLAYLSALWKTLNTYEFVENNPVIGIDDRTPTPKIVLALTDAQREQIKDHLSKEAPAFLRAVMIFFASGGREEEMCRIQGRDVDLGKQEFIAEIRKGKAGWRRVTKAITDAALPDWKEAMIGCGPDDYVFSDRWRPGPNRNGGEKYSRWWVRLVKVPLGIEADMYDLKRLHSTEVANKNEQMAADFNSHADTRMNEKHYDQLSEKRKLEVRKRQNLKF